MSRKIQLPFNTRRSFAVRFSNNEMPCRIAKHSSKHELIWVTPIEFVKYNPIILYFADGLRNSEFPYSYAARQGFADLLSARFAIIKTVPLLRHIARKLKFALEDRSDDVFEGALLALLQLSLAVRERLVPHLSILLPPLAPRLKQLKYHERVIDALHFVELHCGRVSFDLPSFSEYYLFTKR